MCRTILNNLHSTTLKSLCGKKHISYLETQYRVRNSNDSVQIFKANLYSLQNSFQKPYNLALEYRIFSALSFGIKLIIVTVCYCRVISLEKHFYAPCIVDVAIFSVIC